MYGLFGNEKTAGGEPIVTKIGGSATKLLTFYTIELKGSRIIMTVDLATCIMRLSAPQDTL